MNELRHQQRNRFHEQLGRYVNGAFDGRPGRLVALLAPGAMYRWQAQGLVDAFQGLAPPPALPEARATIIDVPPYAGGNAWVRRLASELEPLAPQLAGAYVHGSLGTGEEIAYSDFDALVILRDSVFAAPATLAAVASRLGALRHVMFEYDPLQHHGWFVLVESDLQDYCQAWFPTVLFPWARSLLPTNGKTLAIHTRDSTAEYHAAFANLATSIVRKIRSGPPDRSAYALKGMLSEILLLPSLYLQARDQAGVFKRFSFAIAARDFAPEVWAPMDEVSRIRSAWHYELSPPMRFALTRLVAGRRLVTRGLPVPVPPDIRSRLTAELWTGVERLVAAMAQRIGRVPGP